MTKSLGERLKVAKGNLDTADSALARNAGKLSADVETHFRDVIAFNGDVDHLIGMVAARSAAWQFLVGLELSADKEDCVPFGRATVKFQHGRMLGLQAYMATTWALADRLAATVGRVWCTPAAGSNPLQPPQLVAEFIMNDGRKKSTAAALYKSVRHTWGWPIGISYAIRNHLCHEGGQLARSTFFEGLTAASGFRVSADGWDRVEERAKGFGVEPAHLRTGSSWPRKPHDDLRTVLEVCEREMDDALGVLLGSASGAILSHLGYMVGED